MNKAELIKGIDMTIDALNVVKTALVADETETPNTKKTKVSEPDTAPINATEGVDIDALNAMGYNDFKKYAASLGVKCTGTRDEIMKRVLAASGAENVSEPETEDEAPVEKPKKRGVKKQVEEETSDTPTEEKSDRPVGGKRKLAKKTDEPTTDEFDEQAAAVVASTDVEDIISALAEVDVKATKKNVTEKLAHALREGLIELDDDEAEDSEDETSDDTSDTETDEVEIDAESHFSQYDPDGFNDPDKMTAERREAVVTKMDEVLTDVSEDTLTAKDIQTYLEENATQTELDLLGDDPTEDDMLMLYMELVKRTIDDEGAEHNEGEDPYEVNGEDFCCAHPLKYVKKTKKYVCEVCGTEYEAE